jgi:hypothetical protein
MAEVGDLDELLASKGNIEEFQFILNKVCELNKSGKIAGRKIIAQLSDSFNYPLSEEKVRLRTDTLAKLGLLSKHKGRSGMLLTPKGLDFLKNSL